VGSGVAGSLVVSGIAGTLVGSGIAGSLVGSVITGTLLGSGITGTVVVTRVTAVLAGLSLAVGTGFGPEGTGGWVAGIEAGIKTSGEGAEANSLAGGSGESTPTARPTAGWPHPVITKSKVSRPIRTAAWPGFIKRLREYDILKYPHRKLIIIAENNVTFILIN